VYLNYGIHCLVNVVTEPQDSPAAVLIRALEPLDGIGPMRWRRSQETVGRRRSLKEVRDEELCKGPGNLTTAMGITLHQNRLDLLGERLFIEDRGVAVGRISWGPRIGIRVGTDRPWRAWLDGHPSVSRQRLAAH
jgi:DNA-3-methyladenine glycosylase